MTRKKILSIFLVAAIIMTIIPWTLVSAAPTISILNPATNLEYEDIDGDTNPEIYNGEIILLKGTTGGASDVIINIIGPEGVAPTNIYTGSCNAAQYAAGWPILISSDTNYVKYGRYKLTVGYNGNTTTSYFDVIAKKKIVQGTAVVSQLLGGNGTNIIDGVNQKSFSLNIPSVGTDTLTVSRGITASTLPDTALVSLYDLETGATTANVPIGITYTGTYDLATAGYYNLTGSFELTRGIVNVDSATVNALIVKVVNVGTSVTIGNVPTGLTTATTGTIPALTADVVDSPNDSVAWSLISATALTANNNVSNNSGLWTSDVINLDQSGNITIIGAGSAVVKAVSTENNTLSAEVTITVTTNITELLNPSDYPIVKAADANDAAAKESEVSSADPAAVTVTLIKRVADDPVTMEIPVSTWAGNVNYQTVGNYTKTGTLNLPTYVTNTSNFVPTWNINVRYAAPTGVDIYNGSGVAFNPVTDVVDIYLESGTTSTISGKVEPFATADQAVTWAVSNGSSVAFNSETGLISTSGYGKSTITATSNVSNALSKTITVYVFDKILSFTQPTAIQKTTGDDLLAAEYPTTIKANLASGGTIDIPITYAAPADFSKDVAKTNAFTGTVTSWNPTQAGPLYGISNVYTALVPDWNVAYNQVIYPYEITLSDSTVITENGNQGIDITIAPSAGTYTGQKWLVIQTYSDTGSPITVASMSIQDGLNSYSTTYTISNTLVHTSKYRVSILSTQEVTGIALAQAKEINEAEWLY